MAQKKDATLIQDDTTPVNLGVTEFPFSALRSREPIDANGRAVVLFDERVKLSRVIDGKVITFTAQLFIQRDPVSDAEVTRVATAKAERDKRASERKLEDQTRREREIEAARSHALAGVQTGMETMARLGPALTQAAKIAKSLGLADTGNVPPAV